MVYFQTKPDMLSNQWKGPETLSIEAWQVHKSPSDSLEQNSHANGEWFTVPQEKAPLRIVLARFGYTVVIVCYNSQLTTHNHVYPYDIMFRTDFPGIQHI